MEEIFSRHYIEVDGSGRILSGWSDGPCPGKDISGAVLLREDGGYQFRLFPGGEENPVLLDEYGASLYRYENGKVRFSSAEEIAAQREEILASLTPVPPSPEEVNAMAIAELSVIVSGLMGGGVNVQ